MKATVKDINKVISSCNDMISFIGKNGDIKYEDNLYEQYKRSLIQFFNNFDKDKNSYVPYRNLFSSKLYYSSSLYTVNMLEAQSMLNYLMQIKKDLFSDVYNRIFISHRELDKAQINLFVDLLHVIGIPRPTTDNSDSMIFCTSHPEGYIANGERNLEVIKNEFSSENNTFFILWYTDNYFSSQACLNEMGAIWVSNKKYQEILMPKFNPSNIKGLMDKQTTWFKADDKFRLNDFKKQIEKMFGLPSIEQNSWEMSRDRFIKDIQQF